MPSEVGAYYAIVRFIPDPLRDEPINIGLILASADGSWSRFDVRVPKTKLLAIRRRDDAERIEEWAARIHNRYETHGFAGLFRDYGRLDEGLLREWAAGFGSSIRISEPRAAAHESLDRLWDSLFKALVWSNGPSAAAPELATPAPAAPRLRNARQEREHLVQQFLAETRRWPTFDQSLVHTDATFDGRHGRHLADIAILNGRLTGVVQALPIVHGTEHEIITKRALIVDAAIDLEDRVQKLALYDDPPAARLSLLGETLDVVASLPTENRIRLVPARQFSDLEAELGRVLFPELRRSLPPGSR